MGKATRLAILPEQGALVGGCFARIGQLLLGRLFVAGGAGRNERNGGCGDIPAKARKLDADYGAGLNTVASGDCLGNVAGLCRDLRRRKGPRALCV